MLSFPAQKWSTALTSVSNKRDASNPRFGRAASLIVPRVYLSDYFTARDTEALNRLGITHVISVIEQDTDIPDCIPPERKLHIRIPDQADANILVHLDRSTEFITSALAENDSNKVLVSVAGSKLCIQLNDAHFVLL
jgi:atypical dual specificity phosphatase